MILIYFVYKSMLANNNRKYLFLILRAAMAHFYPNIHGPDHFLHQRSFTLLKHRAELFVQLLSLVVKRSVTS